MVARGDIVNPEAASALLDGLEKLKDSSYRTDLGAFNTFLPPRLVGATKEGCCVPFFGAGISAEADVPLWWDLLSRLGIQSDLAAEPELKHDPLTAAELLASRIGMPALDDALRRSLERACTPTLAHYLLAALGQDVYVTTNYDPLFEIAWKKLNRTDPRVITTDADLTVHGITDSFAKDDGRPIVFKIHGSVCKPAEELILTRSQYRRHYRTNREMFEAARICLGYSNTLFVGFGHRDPEITRLVEDVIHAFETKDEKIAAPAFYSLQFNMGEQTPEIFAARGIVALRPPLSLETSEGVDPRTVSLVRSQFDLLGAVDSAAHADLDLGPPLSMALERIGQELERGLGLLDGLASELSVGSVAVNKDRLRTVGEELGDLAGQGVYVLSTGDEIRDVWLPDGLADPRRLTVDLHRRSYVQQAHMYREPFVSTVVESVFNGNATVFLCVPVLDERKEYHGLVFSAAQVGAWRTPLEIRDGLRGGEWGEQLSFVLIDSDGILLVPPQGEFKPSDEPGEGEAAGGNLGFSFDRLRRLSRRDKLVERVWNNIVPLARDDDVLRMGEVEMYSIVADVPRARWKLALSVPAP